MIKRMILILLLCKLSIDPSFAQKNDSLELAKEMERLNRLGDSLHRVQQERDSAFRENLQNSLRDVQRDIEKQKQKELEAATKQVMEQRNKEQRSKRKAIQLAILVCMVVLVAGGVFFRRQRSKKNKNQDVAD